ncbi:MAG: type II toxin-antitoxin system prevent-host-death family antitoxin [Arcobacter sp.]|nr:type II toxin-antitoxin system prevent-host-death family antitoxin [Arcobacter sp.]
MVIMANEVKTKGVSLFDMILEKAEEIIINVRGKNKFVVVDVERYKYLRGLELDRAYLDAKQNIQEGKIQTLDTAQKLDNYLNELKNEL